MRPPRTGTSLERRRLIDRGRRLLASVLAGLAVLAILQCLESTVATQTVLLAAADIDRGQTIRAGDVEAVSVPVSDAFAGALRHVADAEGLIARVDIAEGMPILGTLAGERPATPPGHTVIDVRLSGGWEGLLPGDAVGLTASGICSGILAAGVPGRGEYGKTCTSEKAHRERKSSVCIKSASLSPGNPTIRSVVIEQSGKAARRRWHCCKKKSVVYRRFMRASVRSQPLCSDKWKCGRRFGCCDKR